MTHAFRLLLLPAVFAAGLLTACSSPKNLAGAIATGIVDGYGEALGTLTQDKGGEAANPGGETAAPGKQPALATGPEGARVVAFGANAQVSDGFREAAAALQRINDQNELARASDSLSGQLYASSQALTFQQSATLNRALGNRVDRVAGEVDAVGVWFDGYGSRGKLSQSGFAKGDTSLWGGQMGVDTRLNDRMVAGVAMNWGDGRASFDRLAGRSRSSSLGLSLYGRYGEATGIYGMTRLGVSRIDTKVERDVQIAGSHRVDAKRKDTMFTAYAEAGYVARVGEQTRATPFVGLAYDQLRRGAISESGHDLALRAQARTYGKTAALAGLRVATDVQWAGGVTTLQGYGLYRHALGNKSLDFNAAYAGAPGRAFRVQGIGLPGHSGLMGLGLSTQATTALTWSLGVDAQVGRGGLQNMMYSAGVRYAF